MAEDHPNKKAKLEEMVKIGTHSGTFHADESLAVFMLKQLPRFANAQVVRSRDYEVLETCDVIVDVTGKYDGTKHFDHHQREFADTFGEEYKTRLSSAGLVYKHFGREILGEMLKVPPTDKSIDVLFPKIYTEFVEAIDANDNGISAFPSDVTPAFRANSITLPSMVSRLNPLWTEPSDDATLDKQFSKASALMGSAFEAVVRDYGLGWYPAKSVVAEAFEKRKEYDVNGRIVVLEQFAPWKDHLYNIEADANVSGEVWYVLYSDGKGWRVQAVSKTPGSFESRKALPEPWRGARDEKLDEISGVKDCVFVHASGFIGGNKTKEGALEMAKLAVNF
ncbi:hypothetical protein TRVA0_019S01706 [Trichomonascus vanleenenianus]|uniref:Myg1p n=1 Tax=Trichomonascus vanleenenianus TaxID=2268995 RepID=UPI003ECAEB5C